MDPTLVLGTWFESQFQICVYEHAILRIYISFFSIMHYITDLQIIPHHQSFGTITKKVGQILSYSGAAIASKVCREALTKSLLICHCLAMEKHPQK